MTAMAVASEMTTESTRSIRPVGPRSRSPVGVFVVVGLAYAAGATMAWRIFGADIGLAFFPPSGVTLAAMVLLPRRRWWAVVAAVVVAEITVDLIHGLSLTVALGYAVANAVEPIVGASVLLRLVGGEVRLDRRRDFGYFLIAAVGIGPAVGGVIGGLVKWFESDLGWWDSAWHWWAGDGLGVLAVAPPILLWRSLVVPRGWKLVEALGVLALVVVTSVLSFITFDAPPASFVLPVLVWVALRFGVPGVAIANAAMAMIANGATASGRGPFAALDVSAPAQLTFAQVFLTVVIVTVWFLAVETSERASVAVAHELEQVARQRADATAKLGELSESLVGESSVDGIAEAVARRARAGYGADAVAIGVYDVVADRFEDLPSSLPDAVRRHVGTWTCSTRAPGPMAMVSGAAVWIDDAAEIPTRYPDFVGVAEALRPGAVGALPLRVGGETRGYLALARGVARPFTAVERDELELVARVAGQAIERAELFEAEQAARIEAERSRAEVDELLVLADLEAFRLRESELRFQQLSDQSPLLIWVHDNRGELEWVNRTYCEYFGVLLSDMHSHRWQMLVHPDDIDGYGGAFAEAVRNATAFHARARVRDARGDWRWIESWGQPRLGPDGEYLGHVGASADVTDRERAEAELEAAHAFVQDVTSLVPGVIAVYDLSEQRNVFVSRASFDALGYESEEVIALGERFLTSVLHPDDAAGFAEHLEAARHLADGESTSLEYRLRHRSGSWCWFRSVSLPLRRDVRGEVTQLASLTIDVTEQRQHEELVQASAALDAYRTRLTDALVDLDDPIAVHSTATRMVAEHVGVDGAVYVELDESASYGTVLAEHPPGPDAWQAYSIEQYSRALAPSVRAGATIVVDDVDADERFDDTERAAMHQLAFRSLVVRPLRDGGRAGGILVVHRSEAGGWSPRDLAAIEATVERLAQAEQRARALQSERNRRERAVLLAEVLSGLEQRESLGDAMQHLVGSLVPALADYAIVERFEPEHSMLGLAHVDPSRVGVLRELRERHRLGADTAITAARAAAHREPQLLSVITPALQAEFATDERTASLLDSLGPRSHIAVPIDLGDGAGALLLGLSNPERAPFHERDLAFVQDLVQRTQVALAAHRVRRAEHQIAITLQNALLPDSVRWDPAAAVEARYRAANDLLQVGGDWYDTFAWADGRIGVMVGDVVGHTLESAAAMGRLRAATSALAAAGDPSPSGLLDALDRFAGSHDGVSFATAACVVIDPRTGTLTYAGAGHPPALVVHLDGRVTRLDDAQSRPLASRPGEPRSEASLVIEAGAVVVLYSDGLIERRGESLDVGLARLEAALVQRRSQPIAELIDGLIDDLTCDVLALDDVVVAVFRYAPVLAELHLECPAHGHHLADMRRQIREWLAERAVDTPTSDALLTIVGEASTNVIDHAYRFGRRSAGIEERPTMPLVVDLIDHGDELVARISDRGAWRPPGSHSRDRGRGTLIMRGLSSRYERQTTSVGTTVTLAVPASSRFRLVDR